MSAKRTLLALLLAAACGAAVRAASRTEPQPAPAIVRRSPFARWFGKRLDRSMMKEGFRAMPVMVDSAQLANVRTGDRVDLVAVFTTVGPSGKDRHAATLLQNALVLGVSRAERGQKAVVTLRLNPNAVQLAALASVQAELFVALRKDGDQDVYPMEMATFKKLLR